MNKILIVLVCIFVYYMSIKLYTEVIRPWRIEKGTKEIEKNPKWLTPILRNLYYGLDDVDIVLVTSKYGMLPRFQISKTNRIELLLPEDTSPRALDDIARAAFIGKISLKIGPVAGMMFSDKPAYWLSILCYMLDGGDIKQSAISWRDRLENK